MAGKFICCLHYQRYNKKKKPWRSFKTSGHNKRNQKARTRKYLYLILLLEAAVLLPQYGETMVSRARGLFLVSREFEEVQESGEEAFLDRKAGETREQGLSVDWKEGTVKLWQRVERVISQEAD